MAKLSILTYIQLKKCTKYDYTEHYGNTIFVRFKIGAIGMHRVDRKLEIGKISIKETRFALGVLYTQFP